MKWCSDVLRENEVLKGKLAAKDKKGRDPHMAQKEKQDAGDRRRVKGVARRFSLRKSPSKTPPVSPEPSRPSKREVLQTAEENRAEWANQMTKLEHLIKKEGEKAELEEAKVVGNYMTPSEVACLRKLVRRITSSRQPRERVH